MIRLDNLPNQHKDEKLVIFLRRFWLTPFFILASMILLYAVPGAVFAFYYDAIRVYLAQPLLGPVLVVILSMYVMGVWLVGLLEFTDYYLDVWIVTNLRIINVEQKGLFARVASELPLMNVQDATSTVTGMLHTFLNYGDVHIQTAGEKERFLFKDVPHPERVKEQIITLMEQVKRLPTPPPSPPPLDD